MSSKREREYQHRRLEKWQERQAKARAARRRRNIVAGSVLGVVAVAVVAAVVISQTTDAPADEPTATPTPSATASSAALDYSPRTGNGGVVPDASLAEGRTWTGTVSTNAGDIGIELDGAAAPQAVANFVTLAQEGYFDLTKCHRLVTTTIHILQCGDPTASGTGTPGYSWGPIENPPSDDLYPAGTLAMARVGDQGESMGSQFFFVYDDSTIPSDSAGGYTVFGTVTSGLDVLQAIADAGTTTVETPSGTVTAPVSDVIIERVETQ